MRCTYSGAFAWHSMGIRYVRNDGSTLACSFTRMMKNGLYLVSKIESEVEVNLGVSTGCSCLSYYGGKPIRSHLALLRGAAALGTMAARPLYLATALCAVTNAAFIHSTTSRGHPVTPGGTSRGLQADRVARLRASGWGDRALQHRGSLSPLAAGTDGDGEEQPQLWQVRVDWLASPCSCPLRPSEPTAAAINTTHNNATTPQPTTPRRHNTDLCRLGQGGSQSVHHIHGTSAGARVRAGDNHPAVNEEVRGLAGQAGRERR